MEPIIEFQNFSFKYRSQKEPTLKDINLAIYPGEKVLIVGPSGSGKSTLAHCINGLVPFSYAGDITGTYRIKGEDPAKLGIFGLSKSVGTVLQDTDGQFIGLTVAEDIAFALENDRVEYHEMRGRVDKAADAVDVKDLLIEHRLEDALYRDVDRIIVVGEGKIVADTTPDELLAANVLAEEGIREPLYITALKHAGCEIRPETHPAHVETMELSGYKEALCRWNEKVALPEKKPGDDVILSVENLAFSYDGRTPILTDIHMQVQKGEMLAIVGKNGAGKSTLSNLICGFLKPGQGRILFGGEDIADWSIKERGEKIGLVMQNPNQMISKPMIYDEVALGLAVRGVPEEEIKERVYATLKICGLYQFRNWPVSALSFGQKKRVTIASILVLHPQVLILDEPTAGQDYRHYTEIMEFLKKLNEEYGITIIMITHDMHLMLEYTNRAVVIADGRLLADTAPAAVLTDDAVADRAYLKKTSLYDLAVRCGIAEPTQFVERFIGYERQMRAAEREEEA